MNYHILVDFGSTFTKAAVVRSKDASVVFSTKQPSSVKNDASIAMNQCFSEIAEKLGNEVLESAHYHASSSAAGGLRMAVIGLTERLSLAAGKNVAFGAGAKIINIVSGKITPQQLQELEAEPLEMLLFCGGYEKGSRSILLDNAKILSESKLQCPIIFGGNSAVASEIRTILLQEGKECFLVPNIIPNVGELNTAACEEIIRDLFMKRIVNMKGLSNIQAKFGDIIPTPAAVLEAGELFSKGTKKHKGYGNLLIVDIGGATTDIHSYAEHVAGEGAKVIGAAEPYAKRTVEGDLGMRESSDTLVQEAGSTTISSEVSVDENVLRGSVDYRLTHTEFVPETIEEIQLDQVIAQWAAHLAVRRHVGRWDPVHSSNCANIQVGKNLKDVGMVLGTGGPIINSKNPKNILQKILKTEEDNRLLLPSESNFFMDRDYILYAVGLLSLTDKDFAFKVMENSILNGQL